MKYLILFLVLITLNISTSYAAESDIVRGQVSQGKKLPLYTNEDLTEALDITDECKANDFWSLHYDCDCVGLQFLELRRTRGPAAQRFWLRDTAQRKCPNAPAMAGKVYTECLSWAPAQRGEDYQEFCACYSSTYGKIYRRNPVSGNLLISEAQMTEAMSRCNVNSVNIRAQERAEFIEKLKANGTYEKLFPSAESNPQ